MKVHNVKQGSPEWHALRAKPNTYTASEASAMMGASKYQTRTELLLQKHTGVTPDVDAVTQARFQDGHDTEAQFLPVAEKIVDDDLSPLTGTIELDGMILLASFDGLNFDYSTAYEHKLFNAGLARDIETYGEPGPHYFWQMEHQLLVCGGQRVLFATSNGTEEGSVTCWYESKPERRAQLIAGWKQFAKDLAEFVPQEVVDKPVAAAVTALPAVMVQITGDLVVRDNFAKFETALRDFIDNRLIREPSTDQEFADLDLQIKALKNAEEALNAAEAQMLSQVSTVDTVKRTKDMLHKLARDNRLMAEKLLAARKEEIKAEIVAGGVSKFREHIAALNERLGKPYMPVIPADFGGAVKNKRTVDSLREAVGNELTRAKISASEVADRIDANLKFLREHAAKHAFLFADTGTIVLKAADDLQTLVRSRIAEHEAAEASRLEAERERIRAEEAAKLQREAEAKAAAEKAEAERLERQRQAVADAAAMTKLTAVPEAASQIVTATPAPAQTPIQILAESAPVAAKLLDASLAGFRTTGLPQLTSPALSAGIGSFDMEVATEPTDDGARLTLTQLNAAIAPVSIDVAGLASLGFEPVKRDKNSRLYRACDLPTICAAMARHLESVSEGVAA